jgi:hypothetical protein
LGRSSRHHQALVVAVASIRHFGWRRVVSHHPGQNSAGEVGGSGGVAAAAADDQPAIRSASGCYFLHVVGGQVGAEVGGLAFPSWAPIAHDGAVVGDDALAAAAFCCVVVKVGATHPLGLVLVALAVVASRFAS